MNELAFDLFFEGADFSLVRTSLRILQMRLSIREKKADGYFKKLNRCSLSRKKRAVPHCCETALIGSSGA
jgi:hypothetical protein